MKQSEVWRDFFSAMAESWKKLKTSNLFSSFIVSSNRNRSALVRELLCNNSLFVGQLYEDKSLAGFEVPISPRVNPLGKPGFTRVGF